VTIPRGINPPGPYSKSNTRQPISQSYFVTILII